MRYFSILIFSILVGAPLGWLLSFPIARYLGPIVSLWGIDILGHGFPSDGLFIGTMIFMIICTYSLLLYATKK